LAHLGAVDSNVPAASFNVSPDEWRRRRRRLSERPLFFERMHKANKSATTDPSLTAAWSGDGKKKEKCDIRVSKQNGKNDF
jgi:hypothetical protein